MLFKKKIICTEDEEDDDYEYIGDDNGRKKPNINSTSIKNDSSSSGISIKDKRVRFKSIYLYANIMECIHKHYIFILSQIRITSASTRFSPSSGQTTPLGVNVNQDLFQ